MANDYLKGEAFPESAHWNYSEVLNMETYKNSYTENEDQALWKLHEIRHRLHKRLQNKKIEEINEEVLKKYSEWQEERE